MHPVREPEFGVTVTVQRVLECPLQRYHCGVVFCGELRHHIDPGGHGGVGGWQHERFAQKQVDIGKCRNRICQQLVVSLGKLRDGFLVVVADKDAEQIRMELDRVRLPAGSQVSDAVAPDAAIEKNNLVFRI